MSLFRIWLLARKETWHILRDMRTLYMAFGVPVLMLLLFGWALTTDVDQVPLMVVDWDRSCTSRELVQGLEHAGSFQVVEWLESPAGLDRIFRQGGASAALVIPAGFEGDIERGQEVALQLIADGTNANDAAIAIAFAQAQTQTLSLKVIRDAMARRGMGVKGTFRPPIRVASRNWFNPEPSSQWYLVPGLIAVIMAMMTSILMALTVAREWERGTMEQLLVTPVTRVEILLGKLIPYFTIGLGQLVLVASCGVLFFDIPLKGSMGLLFGASSLFLLAGLGAGLLISVATRNQQHAMFLAIMTSLLPSFFLSGFLSPIASMPDLIQQITCLIPARYFLILLRGIFLKGVPWDAVQTEIAALAGFAALFVGLGVAKFRTRLD